MPAKVSLRYKDYSGEKSSASWNAQEPSGAAFDITAWLALQTTIASAIDAITLGVRGPHTISWKETSGSESFPADASAQRESGVRVFYQDDVNKETYHMTLPCPDHDLLAETGSDNVDLTITEMATFVTAFEAGALSPDLNAVTVYAAKIVGRRN